MRDIAKSSSRGDELRKRTIDSSFNVFRDGQSDLGCFKRHVVVFRKLETLFRCHQGQLCTTILNLFHLNQELLSFHLLKLAVVLEMVLSFVNGLLRRSFGLLEISLNDDFEGHQISFRNFQPYSRYLWPFVFRISRLGLFFSSKVPAQVSNPMNAKPLSASRTPIWKY